MIAYKKYDDPEYYVHLFTSDKMWILIYNHDQRDSLIVSYKPSFIENLENKVWYEKIDTSFLDNLKEEIKIFILKKLFERDYK